MTYLRECNYCKKQLSSDVKVCIHCGKQKPFGERCQICKKISLLGDIIIFYPQGFSQGRNFEHDGGYHVHDTCIKKVINESTATYCCPICKKNTYIKLEMQLEDKSYEGKLNLYQISLRNPETCDHCGHKKDPAAKNKFQCPCILCGFPVPAQNKIGINGSGVSEGCIHSSCYEIAKSLGSVTFFGKIKSNYWDIKLNRWNLPNETPY